MSDCENSVSRSFRALAFSCTLMLPCTDLLAMDPLANFKWQNRVLLVFEAVQDSAYSSEFDQQLKTQLCGLQDRDLIVVRVPASTDVPIDNKPETSDHSISLRQRYSVSGGAFSVILIGKDGGEKLRSDDRVDLGEIFALIDTMPMRRAEMRERAATCPDLL